MFGTIIMDAYKKDEMEEIAYALDELCSPRDNYGWASAGVYCFWDYSTKEVYYIGLAVDLAQRFKQHNGLMKMDENCCKKIYIDEYFKGDKKLGYTIFVQSIISQPKTYKNQDIFNSWLDKDPSRENYIGKEGHDHIKLIEGILLEAYKKKHGYYPKWNKIGGSVYGQKIAGEWNYKIVKAFNDIEANPLVSRSTLRELSNNPTYEGYEKFFHAIRMSMLNLYMDFYDALNFHIENDRECWDRINEDNYLKKRLVL